MARCGSKGRWTRREFLVAAAAGGAGVALVPGFLARRAWAGEPALPPPGSCGPNYFSRFDIDEGLLRKLLTRAMSKGGDFADLYFQHSIGTQLRLKDGEVNSASSKVELGCGVRVLKGDQTGFAFTEDLTPASLLAAAATAAVIADGPQTPIEESIRRIEPPSYYRMEIPWTEVGIDKRIPLLERANQRAMEEEPRLVKVSVYLGDVSKHILIAASDGRLVEDFQPMAEAYVSCVAEHEGRRESNGYGRGRRQGFEFFTPANIDDLATKAARRTGILFDAAPPPAGEYPVVLAPGLSGILLHEAIGHGMEADFNRKGISVYADRIGKRIAPDFVTIVDDGTNDSERGTINVDDEGNESQRTVLVEDGILKSYMHDRISAAHYRVAPTSNGRRECYRHPPVPRMRNTYMLNGPHNAEEIIRSVKKGLYAETFTNGQVNIGSGDFSFYLKNGFLIENGKITRPAKDANLTGFGPKVLEEVQMVADDLALFAGPGWCGKDGQRAPVGFGLPTVKCNGISVGGVG